MLIPLKRKLGQVKRGLHGWLLNVSERPKLPSSVPSDTIGRSHHGQPIHVHRLGSGRQKILLVGGLHGNEIGSIKAVTALTGWLHQQAHFHDAFTFFTIPCLNPDGNQVARQKPHYFGGGRHGRFNANNVDLNRNFPTQSFQSNSDWCHGKNYADRTPVFCGNAPGSEPEMQVLLKLIESEKIQGLFIYHTAGGDVMGNVHPIAQQLAPLYANGAGYKHFDLKDWPALNHTGSAKEWCDENDVFFLEIEGSTRWGSDQQRHQRGLEEVLKKLQYL